MIFSMFNTMYSKNYEELISLFEDQNYLVFSNQNSIAFNKFSDLIKRVIYKEVGYDGFDLADLHNHIGDRDVNKIRIAVFRELNALPNWEDNYYYLASNILRDLFGPDISIQIKLNFSIQMPGDETSVLALHSDTLSGQSPFECVLWTAITDAFDSNSMYIFDKDISKKMYKELPNYQYIGMSKMFKDYGSLSNNIETTKGQCILFSSTLFHGNQLNKTDKTRISLNCRFKSLFSPEYSEKPHERVTGQFYKMLYMSPVTKIGLSYDDQITF